MFRPVLFKHPWRNLPPCAQKWFCESGDGKVLYYVAERLMSVFPDVDIENMHSEFFAAVTAVCKSRHHLMDDFLDANTVATLRWSCSH